MLFKTIKVLAQVKSAQGAFDVAFEFSFYFDLILLVLLFPTSILLPKSTSKVPSPA